jgi:glucokinase
VNGDPSATFGLIDFGGSAIRARLTTGSVFSSLATANASDGDVLESAEKLISSLIQATGLSLSGMGIAVPGVVDKSSRALMAAHGKYSSLRGVNLHEWVNATWGIPCAIENDARVALLGEISTGVAKGAHNAVCVILGTGIGTAAMVNGKLLHGHTGHGGILGGHLTVDIHADACPCGNVGCAESLASTWALTATAGKSGRPYAEGIRELLSRSEAGEPDAIAIINDYVRVWGATIVSLCHLFDPDTVVVTGGPMQSAEILLPPVTAYVTTHLWSSLETPVIVSPPDPHLSVFRGLARLATGHTE